jgi:hypothetical protein
VRQLLEDNEELLMELESRIKEAMNKTQVPVEA